MKQILVLGGNGTEVADREELVAFVAGVREAYQDAMVDGATLDQLQLIAEPGKFSILLTDTARNIADYDLVILRHKMRTYNTLAYCLSRYCVLKNIPFFNDYSAYFPGTKVAQAICFYEQNLPFLKTVYAMGHDSLTAAIKRELSLPFVLKDALGAKGTSNYLIKSYDELAERLRAEPDVAFIAQEFCPNDRDFRIVVAGEKQLIFKRQGAADTHLNNTSTGAKATLADAEVPAEIIEQAHELAASMHLHVAGIDVMPHLETGAFYFIETNSQPQLFTGAFLTEKQQLFGELLRDLL